MDIVSEFLTRLPAKYKKSPSGWISGNAVCCHHRGHKPDRRGRGGIIPTPDSGFTFSCFNCGFKTGWTPGNLLSTNAKLLLKYLGANEEEVQKINFEALRQKRHTVLTKRDSKFLTREMKLPEGAKPFGYWCENPPKEFIDVLNYMAEKRNPDLINWHEYYWTPNTDLCMNKRIIVPFISKFNKTVQGFSARAIDNKIEPKYIGKYSQGYLFGQENIYEAERKFVIVCEGIFDAISISGCAAMKQTMSEGQIALLKDCGKNVIIVPDKDSSGVHLVEQAIEHEFYVSMPDWPDDGIKDVDDAVKKYGRIPVLKKILDTAESNSVKIKLQMKNWFRG